MGSAELRRRMLAAAAALAVLATVPGAAQERGVAAELATQDSLREQLQVVRRTRLWRIATLLRAGNVGLCPRHVGRLVGAMALSGTDRAVVVVAVIQGSPAHEAGLAPGDRVLAVEGDRAPLPGWLEVVPGPPERGPVAIRVRRGAGERTLQVQPRAACDIPVELTPDASLGAVTTRRHVRIATGMMRFATSDADLALVVGHEMAHWLLRHVGGPGGLAAELEADHHGTFLTANGGFDVQGAPDFWRRYAAEPPHRARSSPGAFVWPATQPFAPPAHPNE
jgi:hypothetical protein